jgi:hypothetical protein
MRIYARVGRVKCAGTVTPHVNRFPAGTLRYQETEIIYIFLRDLVTCTHVFVGQIRPRGYTNGYTHVAKFSTARFLFRSI